jgi:hypothetical protein
MAYTSRNEKGEWGLALSSAAQGSLIDIVGASFFPLYRVVGPMIFFLSLMLLVWGGLRLMVTVLVRVIVIVRCKGCGIWVLTPQIKVITIRGPNCCLLETSMHKLVILSTKILILIYEIVNIRYSETLL